MILGQNQTFTLISDKKPVENISIFALTQDGKVIDLNADLPNWEIELYRKDSPIQTDKKWTYEATFGRAWTGISPNYLEGEPCTFRLRQFDGKNWTMKDEYATTLFSNNVYTLYEDRLSLKYIRISGKITYELPLDTTYSLKLPVRNAPIKYIIKNGLFETEVANTSINNLGEYTANINLNSPSTIFLRLYCDNDACWIHPGFPNLPTSYYDEYKIENVFTKILHTTFILKEQMPKNGKFSMLLT